MSVTEPKSFPFNSKVYYQGPWPSLQEHSPLWTLLPKDAIIQHYASMCKLLHIINPSKASGPDGVPCWMLKEPAEERTPALTFIFMQSLTTGEVPSDWKKQEIRLIYKKGPKCEASNHRPVSPTCVTSKLPEHIVCSQVSGHLNEHGILTWFQDGFWAECSCKSQLAVTMHDLHKLFDDGTQVDIGILDFSKAF